MDKIIREREAALGQMTTPASANTGSNASDFKDLTQLITLSHEHIMKSLKILNENQKELYDMMVKISSEKK